LLASTATAILSQEKVFAITHVMNADLAFNHDRSLALRGPGFPAVKRSTAAQTAGPCEIINNALGRNF
jgi:hypothetical protein